MLVGWIFLICAQVDMWYLILSTRLSTLGEGGHVDQTLADLYTYIFIYISSSNLCFGVCLFVCLYFPS